MKRIISILLISLTLVPFIFSEDVVYEFTEAQLREYVEEVISDAYFNKDLEIADIKRDHDLIILDKDFEIEKRDLVIEGDAAIILGLKVENKDQAVFIKWNHVIIVG